MKIALVSPYDFDHPGGVVNHILALNQQLTAMGHEVKIISPLSHSIVSNDDHFLHIGKARPFPVRGTTIRISMSLRLASRIKEVMAREKFDIVHLHEPFMPMLCSAVLRFSDTVNIGTFHACHGSPGYNFGWPFSKIMLRLRQRKLDGRIAVSKAAKNYACKYIFGNYAIIPNGIDLNHFSTDVSPIEEFCDCKLNILFVGRLEKRKGLDYLLPAYHHVKKSHPNSRLIIVGPGTRFRRRYEKFVKRNNIQDVVFRGMVSYNELPRYYKTADIFCSPATGSESFGIVLLEAMALCKPVVATNIEGYASVITSGKEGLLVEPKNEIAIARAIMALITDESLRHRMGERGLLNAQQHSWDRIARRIADYYDEILDTTTGRLPSLEHDVVSTIV
jgi:phosphatidylinositol alpha-mannosyltransferase